MSDKTTAFALSNCTLMSYEQLRPIWQCCITLAVLRMTRHGDVYSALKSEKVRVCVLTSDCPVSPVPVPATHKVLAIAERQTVPSRAGIFRHISSVKVFTLSTKMALDVTLTSELRPAIVC